MKNKFRFAICILLALCMSFSLIGCSSGGNEVESSSESAESTDAEITSEESTTAKITAESESTAESSDDTEETTERIDWETLAGEIKTAELSSYTVVRPNAASNTAKSDATDFARTLSEKWGFGVKLRTDTIMEGVPQYSLSDYEILIGNTNRDESTWFISALNKYDYGYAVINSKIVIAGRTDSTLRMAMDLFIKNVVEVKSMNEEIYIVNDESQINRINITNDRDDKNGKLLKVMSFNVQVWEQSEERYQGVIDQITANMPDSFGVQEADGSWIRELSSRLASSNYSYVGIGRDNDSASEHSAVFYRSDKFELLNSGTKWLSDTPDEPSKVESAGYRRIVSWATLRRISDGEIFTHVNTHLDHLSDTARVDQVTHLLEIVNALPDYPVVLTGDFNAESNERAFELITDNGYVNAASYKLEGDSASHKTYHAYNDTYEGMVIDFGFIRPEDFTVLYYHVCDELTPADHYAIYFEFMFKE